MPNSPVTDKELQGWRGDVNLQPPIRFTLDRNDVRRLIARLDEAELMVHAITEGSGEWEERAKSAERDRRDMHAALIELVTLKDMKDRTQRSHEPRLKAEYERRKPAAWDRARALAGIPLPPPNQDRNEELG